MGVLPVDALASIAVERFRWHLGVSAQALAEKQTIALHCKKPYIHVFGGECMTIIDNPRRWSEWWSPTPNFKCVGFSGCWSQAPSYMFMIIMIRCKSKKGNMHRTHLYIYIYILPAAARPLLRRRWKICSLVPWSLGDSKVRWRWVFVAMGMASNLINQF